MINFHNPRMPVHVHERLSLPGKSAETDACIDDRMLSAGYYRPLKGYAFAKLLKAKLLKENLCKRLLIAEKEIELAQLDLQLMEDKSQLISPVNDYLIVNNIEHLTCDDNPKKPQPGLSKLMHFENVNSIASGSNVNDLHCTINYQITSVNEIYL